MCSEGFRQIALAIRFWNKVVILISYLFTAKRFSDDELLNLKVEFEEPLPLQEQRTKEEEKSQIQEPFWIRRRRLWRQRSTRQTRLQYEGPLQEEAPLQIRGSGHATLPSIQCVSPSTTYSTRNGRVIRLI